jgi:hypothetical protein
LDAFYFQDGLFALHARHSRNLFSGRGEEEVYFARLSALLHRLADAPPRAKDRA